MIKRLLYRQEDGSDSSDSSSSSSSSSGSGSDDPEVEEQDEEDAQVEEEEDQVAIRGGKKKKTEGEKKKGTKKKKKLRSPSPSPSPASGYESEDSSENELDADSSGLPANEEEEDTEKGGRNLNDNKLINEACASDTQRGSSSSGNSAVKLKDPIPADLANCILKCKSVFKCRLCPRIICLTEETIKAHLYSKRHARSQKLLREGRLKLMLNSDGEIEEDQETHVERHDRTVAFAQESINQKKKDSGRQRRSGRWKKMLRNRSAKRKSEQLTKSSSKKRLKQEAK